MKKLFTSIALFLSVIATPLMAQSILSTKVMDRLPAEIAEEIINLEVTVNPPEDFRLIATYTKDWQFDLGGWEPVDSTERYYDENNDQIELLTRVWGNGSWPVDRHTLYTYNDNHLITKTVSESWDGANWIYKEGNSRSFREYNDNGDLTFYHFQQWIDSGWVDYLKLFLDYDPVTGYLINERTQFAISGVLVNLDQYRYLDYDANGNLLTLQYDSWADNDWKTERQETYEYNNSDSRVFELVEISDNAGGWINNSRTYSYYQDGVQVDSSLTENWDGALGWVPISKTYYSYNSNGDQTLALDWNWGAGTNSWIYDSQRISEYDADFNLTKRLEQDWGIGSTNWENLYQDLYTYDEYGNRLTELNQTWDEFENDWINGRHTTNYYETFVSTRDLQMIDAAAATIAPNPGNGLFQLWLDENVFPATEVQMQVLNLIGQPLMQTEILSSNQPIPLQLQHLPKGSYLLQLRQADKLLTKKLIIVK